MKNFKLFKSNLIGDGLNNTFEDQFDHPATNIRPGGRVPGGADETEFEKRVQCGYLGTAADIHTRVEATCVLMGTRSK